MIHPFFYTSFVLIISSPYRYTLHTYSLILLVGIMLHKWCINQTKSFRTTLSIKSLYFPNFKIWKGRSTDFGISDINITFNQTVFGVIKPFFAVKCSSMKRIISIGVSIIQSISSMENITGNYKRCMDPTIVGHGFFKVKHENYWYLDLWRIY